MIRKLIRRYYKLFNYGDMLINHRLNGKFKVKYPDGQISQSFSWKVANYYKDIFGGEVIDNF